MRNNQKVAHFRDRVSNTTMLVIVSPECGIDKPGKWYKDAKERFYLATKQKAIKISLSMNGTYCLTEQDWENLKAEIDNLLKE